MSHAVRSPRPTQSPAGDTRIFLIHRSGHRRVFDNRADAHRYFCAQDHDNRLCIGDVFNRILWFPTIRCPARASLIAYDYILRDAAGHPLDRFSLASRPPVRPRLIPRLPRHRVEPVPGTGRVGWHSRSLRHPKTLACLRAASAPLEEGEPPRRYRANLGLPTAWDERYRATQSSWKAHRKTQWRAREE